MAAWLPTVEVAHHCHALGMRRPHRETHRGQLANLHMPRAQVGAQRLAVAGTNLQQCRFIDLRRKRVRVFDLLHHVRPDDAQAVRGICRQFAFEHTVDRAGLHAGQQLAAAIDQPQSLGAGRQDPHTQAAIGLHVRPQHRKGVAGEPGGDRLQVLQCYGAPSAAFRHLLLRVPAVHAQPFAHDTVATAGAVAAVRSYSEMYFLPATSQPLGRSIAARRIADSRLGRRKVRRRAPGSAAALRRWPAGTGTR